MGATMDGDDRFMIADDACNLFMEIIERVAMLGKDDQLALATGSITHLRCVLQDLGEFVPFAILARCHHGFGFGFKSFENDDLSLKLVDAAGCRGIIDEGLFQVFLFFGIEIVVIFGNIRQCIGQCLATTNAELLFT